MKATIIIVTSLFLSSLAMAKPPEVPNYRGLALKGESSCIDACGEAPDGEDLEASYAYQMCLANCQPRIGSLHQTVADLQNQVDDLKEQVEEIKSTSGVNELCYIYEFTERVPPDFCLNCGDSSLQPLENCDDGNLIAGDGCNSICQLEVCGDGKMDVGEECDDGNVADGDQCSSSCVKEYQRVFVTGRNYYADLGGLSGADAKCNELAQNAGLDGTYKAWLSSSDTAVEDRFTQSDRNYALLDGTIIATDWFDLTDEEILNPINMDENGQLISSGLVWTGTDPYGYSVWRDTGGPAKYCDNWTLPYDGINKSAYAGDISSTDGNWTTYTSPRCNYPARLYCFEQ